MDRVMRIGAGARVARPPIARVPLDEVTPSEPSQPPRLPRPPAGAGAEVDDFEPLTIPEAKVRLARTLGVPEASVKIGIEA